MATAFSDSLEAWLETDQPKTAGSMADVFGAKGFAVTVLLLMSVPALPLPTGGVTHVLEVVVILVGAQMVLGRSTLWLPDRLRRRDLGAAMTGRAIPFIVRRVRWFERHAKRRGARLFRLGWFNRALGVVVVGLALAALLAPPFSGLDTIPSLGAVIVALGITLEDLVVVAAGLLVGAAGIVLMVTVGAAVARLVESWA